VGQHDAVVGNHGVEGDVVDAGGQQFGGVVSFEPEGN